MRLRVGMAAALISLKRCRFLLAFLEMHVPLKRQTNFQGGPARLEL
jgi:hypothetical protein